MLALRAHVVRHQIKQRVRRALRARDRAPLHRLHHRHRLLAVLVVVDVIQRERDLAVVLEPVLRPLLHHLADQAGPTHRNLVPLQRLDRERREHMRATNVLRRVTGIWKLARDQMEQARAQAIDVRAQIRLLLQNVLRRRIRRRALELIIARATGDFRLFARQAEVGQHHRVFRVDHEIRRLHVQVNDVRPRRVLQRSDPLPHEPHRILHVQDAARQNPILQRLPLDEAHRQVRHALLLARRVQRHDVRVAQARHRARLLQEVRHHVRAAHVRPVHDLDRHVAFQRRFDRLEHLAHAALAQFLQHEVRPHAGACREKLLTVIHET